MNSSVLYALCMLPITCFAQQLSDVNGKLLMKAYADDKKEFNTSVEAGRCCYIDYSYVATYSYNVGENLNEKVVEEKGRVYYTKYSRQVVSDEYEVFVDSLDVFSIDKKNNRILRVKSNANHVRFDSTFLKRNVISDSTMKFYRIYKNIQNGITHFKMEALDNTMCMYKSADFYYDSKQNLMTKIHVVYNPEMSSMIKEYTFEVLQRGRKGIDNCNLVAREHVFDKQGRLAAPYVNFKYRDISKQTQL